MAASIETQRLISVSLGKIAQSRGQRGGINLHKNLLVATVLHKARTAYMMESYNNIQRQKLQQEQLLQQQQQQLQVPVQSEMATPVSVSNKAEEMCQAPSDSNLGQPSATPTGPEESRSVGSTGTTPESPVPEPMAIHQVDAEVTQDKENSPPVPCDRLSFAENVPTQESKIGDDHLAAASLLSQEAQLDLVNNNCGKQQTLLTSAATTCTGNVLKRRRDNPSACSQDYECPVSKKARVSGESYTSATYSDYTSDYSDLSSDESDSESDSEMMQISDSPQITNLVSIFNSGFSGLCAVSKDSEHTSSEHQSDLDSSNSQSVCKSLRPESPSPVYSRRMSEPSLLCSTQVGRLETLPSAIILSA